ncbi:MAG: aldehyde dehydrogenase family protein [Actinobacteria bacterium]|nr:aldehyde dehydrogenase family protein [Actinomycetota bacterium]
MRPDATFPLPEIPAGLPIGSEWVEVPGTTRVVFPYDGSTVAEAPVGAVADARMALDEGTAVVEAVGRLSSGTRRAILQAVERELVGNSEEFIELLIAETGKTRIDCTAEFSRSLFTWAAAAEEVGHLHGETVPLDIQSTGEGLLGFWVRKPIGLVIGIAGFNAPLLLASHKIAPAIGAGCPVISKPAPATPLATLWLADIVRRAAAEHGAPPAIVQVLTGDAAVGRTLVSDPRVGAVSFTGSAAVGHQIARDAAPRKTLLELGSNTALVVAADADIGSAAEAVVRGGFYFNGQACIAVQRVIVCEEVVDALIAELIGRMGELIVGDPRRPETRIAPLINEAATARVLKWVEEAESGGAKVVHGGGVVDRSIEPTVLLDVPESANAWCEEIFAPVVAIRSVPAIEAAFECVNRSRYGLHASVFTRSLATALAAADRLEVGGVVVNEVPGFRSDIMPYGGVKDSGMGREGPRFAMEELTVTRMVIIRPQ